MRRIECCVVAAVGLMLLAASGAPTTAQDDEASASWVTQVSSVCEVVSDADETSEGGVTRFRGSHITCIEEWSDPRVSGTKTIVYNDDCYPEYAPCVYWGPQELVGPDGTWSGWFNGTIDPDRGATGYVVMVGGGEYEGLTFISHGMGAFGEPAVSYGLIFEGDPPPAAATPME